MWRKKTEIINGAPVTLFSYNNGKTWEMDSSVLEVKTPELFVMPKKPAESPCLGIFKKVGRGRGVKSLRRSTSVYINGILTRPPSYKKDMPLRTKARLTEAKRALILAYRNNANCQTLMCVLEQTPQDVAIQALLEALRAKPLTAVVGCYCGSPDHTILFPTS